MENRQERKQAMFMRVLGLSSGNRITDKPPRFVRFCSELQECVDTISRLQNEQNTGYTKGMDAGYILRARDHVREHFIKPVVDACREDLGHSPVEHLLYTPHKHDSVQKIGKHGQKLAKELSKKKYRALLSEAGFSPAFLTDFRIAAGQLVAATSLRAGSVGRRHSATTGLRPVFEKGMRRVDAMEGMLRHHFEKDPPLEREWRIARRIGDRLGRPPDDPRKKAENADSDKGA